MIDLRVALRDGACLALGLLLLQGCGGASDDRSPAGRASKVERGEYLVTIAACNDCHTPMKLRPQGPEPDLSRMLSGHPQEFAVTPPAQLPEGWVWAGAGTNTAFAGPWGVSFAINLTPDAETGLGVYTEETFVQALRSGRHMGAGRPINPPMPWQAYSRMTDEDLSAIWAYLRSIPAVRNAVPRALPPAAAEGPPGTAAVGD